MLMMETAAPALAPLTGWCVECGATTRDGNGSPAYEGLCADCAEVWADERAAAEERTAERYSLEDVQVRVYRQHAVAAAYLRDWRAFFTAAPLCARALNRREQIIEEVPAAGA